MPVPENGVASRTPTYEELKANLDVNKDKQRSEGEWNPKRVRAMLMQMNAESGT